MLGYAAYLGAVDHHLGTLAAVLGRTDDAVEHLGAALERHRAIEARPWVALSAAWLANVLAERDGPGDAERGPRRCTAEARALAARAGLARSAPSTPAATPGVGQRLKRSRCSLSSGKTSAAASRPMSASRWA